MDVNITVLKHRKFTMLFVIIKLEQKINWSTKVSFYFSPLDI